MALRVFTTVDTRQAPRLQNAVRARAKLGLMRGCPRTRSPGLLTTQAKQHEASIVERPGARVNQAWVDRLACAAALSYPSGRAPRRRR
jgi:hypothetical protein